MPKAPSPRRSHVALRLLLVALAVATILALTLSVIAGVHAPAVLAIVAATVCSTVVIIPVGVVIDLRRDAARAQRRRAEEARARAAAEEAERVYRQASRGPLGAIRRVSRKVVGRPDPTAQRIVDSFVLPSGRGYSNSYATPLALGTDGGWDMFAPASMLLTTVAITTVP